MGSFQLPRQLPYQPNFVEGASRLSRKELAGSVLPKPNPSKLAKPLLPAFSRSLSAVVVFAHVVNRTAGLPFQTYMGQYLTTDCVHMRAK